MEHKNHKDDLKNEAQDDLVFFVRVQYRRNTSWQGTIQWMDGKKSGTFRSVLELGNMIKDAKNEKSGQNQTNKLLTTWQGKNSVS